MSISESVAEASAYLAKHPDEARYRDSTAIARLTDGLGAKVSGPDGETLTTDMPRGIGGTASAPSPGWYFRAAAAACVATLIGIRAAMLGVSLAPGSVEVTVDSESDDRGILGLNDGVPAGALSLRIAVSVNARDLEREQIETMARWAVDHCPVTDTARRAVPIELVVS